MKKQIKLTRIHCAGCAINLEDKIKEVEGVESASIDFLSKTVTIEIPSKGSQEIIDRVEKTITSFDSSIKIVDTSEEEKQEKREKAKKIIDISRVCLAVVLTVVAYFVPIKWLSITLFSMAYLLAAYEIIINAFANIIKGKMLDENFLMVIATIGALVLEEYIEAIAVVLLYTIGEFLEKLAVEKSRRRVKSLLSIKAEVANLVNYDEEMQVSLDVVKVNDIIRIKAGEKVPLDCVVIEGSSSLNMAAITGESKEKFVSVGDELLSGSINVDGVLMCRVTKTEKESTITKIINLVENATSSKAKTERFITKFAKWYTPIVVGVAVLLAVIPWVCGLDFNTWIYRALTFLVVSCPCALVISIPLGYFAGIGASARHGILVKGASFIDLLAQVDTVVFDKTGTLTYGDFEVSKIHAEENTSEDEVLELVAYAESFSNHRIAKSIVKEYGKSINTAWVNDYKEIAGLGVEVELFNEECLVGNAELLRRHNIIFEEANEVGTIVYLAKSNEYMGYVIVEDKIKEDSFSVVEALKTARVNTVSMFTGDNEEIASKVANDLGLDSYYAGLMPEGKVEKLKEIASKGKVAFVGDGINDAPVLASVDVGVSMGGVASDVAVETADVVLMTDKPSQLADAIKISKKTKSIIMQNIIFILLTKVVVMVLSALGISGMWLAIFADVGVCLLAVLNSLRAMIVKKPKENKDDNK